MRHYRAYGLDIASDIELPELATAPGGAADLTIRRVSLPALSDDGDAMRWTPDEARFQWRTVGRFDVTRDAILVDPKPGVADDLTAFPLLGPVLATALHLRGLFVLHASAVSIEGRATVLMGAKGAGKSSTATALASAGHELLADDIVAIEDAPDGPRVLPGFAQVKLSEAALAALSPAGERRDEAHPAIDKVRVRLDAPTDDAVPLERLCILQRGDGDAAGGSIAFEPRAPRSALEDVLTHSYMARFGDAALQGKARLAHLAACARLAARPGTTTTHVPDGLDRLALAGGPAMQRRDAA